MIYKRSILWVSVVFTIILGCVGMNPVATAAQLTLIWNDNSNDEDGFYIDRRVGPSGIYQQIATIGTNSTSYTDINLASTVTGFAHSIQSPI